jgi:hypothetical protein
MSWIDDGPQLVIPARALAVVCGGIVFLAWAFFKALDIGLISLTPMP